MDVTRVFLPPQVPDSSKHLSLGGISHFWLKHCKSLEPADLSFLLIWGNSRDLYPHVLECDIFSECDTQQSFPLLPAQSQVHFAKESGKHTRPVRPPSWAVPAAARSSTCGQGQAFREVWARSDIAWPLSPGEGQAGATAHAVWLWDSQPEADPHVPFLKGQQ